MVLHTALQVGIVVAPAPPQPVALLVKPETWHDDEIQSPCGEEEHTDGVNGSRKRQTTLKFGFLMTSILSLMAKETHSSIMHNSQKVETS